MVDHTKYPSDTCDTNVLSEVYASLHMNREYFNARFVCDEYILIVCKLIYSLISQIDKLELEEIVIVLFVHIRFPSGLVKV